MITEEARRMAAAKQALGAAQRTAATRATVLDAIRRSGERGIHTNRLIIETGLSKSTILRTVNVLADSEAVVVFPDPHDSGVRRYRIA